MRAVTRRIYGGSGGHMYVWMVSWWLSFSLILQQETGTSAASQETGPFSHEAGPFSLAYPLAMSRQATAMTLLGGLATAKISDVVRRCRNAPVAQPPTSPLLTSAAAVASSIPPSTESPLHHHWTHLSSYSIYCGTILRSGTTLSVSLQRGGVAVTARYPDLSRLLCLVIPRPPALQYLGNDDSVTVATGPVWPPYIVAAGRSFRCLGLTGELTPASDGANGNDNASPRNGAAKLCCVASARGAMGTWHLLDTTPAFPLQERDNVAHSCRPSCQHPLDNKTLTPS